MIETKTRRHFLRMPGGRPIEFIVESDDQRSACGACGVSSERERGVDLWHEAECPAARAIVARDAYDITAEGAADFVGAVRAQLAEEYADRETADLADPRSGMPAAATRRIRDRVIAGYLAGYARAEQSALEIVRTGLARMSSEIDAWSGSACANNESKERG